MDYGRSLRATALLLRGVAQVGIGLIYLAGIVAYFNTFDGIFKLLGFVPGTVLLLPFIGHGDARTLGWWVAVAIPTGCYFVSGWLRPEYVVRDYLSDGNAPPQWALDRFQRVHGPSGRASPPPPPNPTAQAPASLLSAFPMANYKGILYLTDDAAWFRGILVDESEKGSEVVLGKPDPTYAMRIPWDCIRGTEWLPDKGTGERFLSFDVVPGIDVLGLSARPLPSDVERWLSELQLWALSPRPKVPAQGSSATSDDGGLSLAHDLDDIVVLPRLLAILTPERTEGRLIDRLHQTIDGLEFRGCQPGDVRHLRDLAEGFEHGTEEQQQRKLRSLVRVLRGAVMLDPFRTAIDELAESGDGAEVEHFRAVFDELWQRGGGLGNERLKLWKSIYQAREQREGVQEAT